MEGRCVLRVSFPARSGQCLGVTVGLNLYTLEVQNRKVGTNQDIRGTTVASSFQLAFQDSGQHTPTQQCTDRIGGMIYADLSYILLLSDSGKCLAVRGAAQFVLCVGIGSSPLLP